jgi:enoyl-CoA hydratase/carnithine racemase
MYLSNFYLNKNKINELNKLENKEFQFLSIERKGKIGILQLSRPDKKNAMNEVMRTEIIEALELLKEEKRIRAVII